MAFRKWASDVSRNAIGYCIKPFQSKPYVITYTYPTVPRTQRNQHIDHHIVMHHRKIVYCAGELQMSIIVLHARP